MFKLFAGICLALLSLVSLIYCSTSIMLFRFFVSFASENHLDDYIYQIEKKAASRHCTY